MTYDHFRPQSQNGTDETANLVYACHACNEFKGEYWSEEEETRLLHPLTDDLKQHFVEEVSGTLQPITTLGQIFVKQLQLNRPALIENRLERQRLLRLESHISEITITLRSILNEIRAKQTWKSPEEQRKT